MLLYSFVVQRKSLTLLIINSVSDYSTNIIICQQLGGK